MAAVIDLTKHDIQSFSENWAEHKAFFLALLIHLRTRDPLTQASEALIRAIRQDKDLQARLDASIERLRQPTPRGLVYIEPGEADALKQFLGIS